jgi:serine/threonine-protein kinase TTK/MPS1
MLQCVQIVHNNNIVHTDLKPANFVLVSGNLKLIDFGISKAIPNDTTNIGRDQQIGTANYMSPEALNDSGRGVDGQKLMKLGRPSDVWSLGCILYQMVYGKTPFHHIKNVAHKIIAIQNPRFLIEFPLVSVPLDSNGKRLEEFRLELEQDLIDVMKKCLVWESKQRATIEELLQHPFLKGRKAEAEAKQSKYYNTSLVEWMFKIDCYFAGQESPQEPPKEPTINPELMAKIVEKVSTWTSQKKGPVSSSDREKMVAVSCICKRITIY